jgi:hypothetical protein
VKQDQEGEPERDEQLEYGDESCQQPWNLFSVIRFETDRSPEV